MAPPPSCRQFNRSCLRSLRVLSCSFTGITDEGVAAGMPPSLCAQLHAIRFTVGDHCVPPSDASLAHLLVHASSPSSVLRSLEIVGWRHATGRTIPHVQLGQLELLDLSGSGVCDAFFESHVAQWSSLRVLCLSSCDSLTDAGVASILANLPRLNVLRAWNCHRITALPFAVVNRFYHLKELCLSGCEELGSDAFTKPAWALQCLETLGLAGCVLVDDCTLSALQHMPGLRDVNLYGCSRITDEGLRLMCNGQHSLSELNLGGCHLLTDLGLRYIVSSGSRWTLRGLNLFRCAQVTDAGLQHVASMAHLRVLSCGFCSLVTDEGVVLIAAALQHLTFLSLIGCLKLTDVSLTSLSVLPKLRELYVCCCPKLTVEGALALRRIETLTAVDFSGCTKMLRARDDLVQQLADALKFVPDVSF